MPSHCVPHVVPGAVPAQARVPCGCPLTMLQVPTLPPTSHAAQLSVHAELQQTPSTQNPEPHSVDEEQLCPRFLPQMPGVPPVGLQFWPVGQDVVAQQTPPTQVPLPHAGGQAFPRPAGGTHLPVASQVKPAAQSVALVAVVHDVLHAVAPHAYGEHVFVTSVHVPEPLQVERCVSTPPLQEFELQVAVAAA